MRKLFSYLTGLFAVALALVLNSASAAPINLNKAAAKAPVHDPSAYSVTVYAQKLGEAGDLHKEKNKYYFLPLSSEDVPDFCSNVTENLPYDTHYMVLTHDSSVCILFDDSTKPSDAQLKEMTQGIFTDITGQKWRMEVPGIPTLFSPDQLDKEDQEAQ